MRMSLHWTVAGDLLIGDANDDHAPLVKMAFYNEFAVLPRGVREHAARKFLEAFTLPVPGADEIIEVDEHGDASVLTERELYEATSPHRHYLDRPREG